ncbi:hypothetical protein EVAR_40376_1 [Eumeta japonica]|uniref:Mos1 transposase HTH domain-containing protein n=1 Tax=Eumeta variegata TaxID=151549 RepID=A0A4C1XIQ6_EUMVA|nr:hypothetical protein EVAR_40376_1 [Eumeta japonica]
MDNYRECKECLNAGDAYGLVLQSSRAVEQKPTQQSLARLRTAFGDEAPYKMTICNWFSEFKHSHLNLSNRFRDDRPSTAVNNKNIDAMRRIFKTDRHVTYHEIRTSLEPCRRQLAAARKTVSSTVAFQVMSESSGGLLPIHWMSYSFL